MTAKKKKKCHNEIKLDDEEADIFLENDMVREGISEEQRSNEKKKKDAAMGKAEKVSKQKGQGGCQHDTFKGQARPTWTWQAEGQKEVRLENQTEPDSVEPMVRCWNVI